MSRSLLSLFASILALMLCGALAQSTQTSGSVGTGVAGGGGIAPPVVPAAAQGVENPKNPVSPNMTVHVDPLENVSTLTPEEIARIVNAMKGQDAGSNTTTGVNQNKTPSATGEQPRNNNTVPVGEPTTEPQPSANGTGTGGQPTTNATTQPSGGGTPPTPSNTTSSIANQSTTGLFAQNTSVFPFVLDTDLSFKAENIDRLSTENIAYQRTVLHLQQQISGFMNSSQLVFVDSNLTTQSLSIYRLLFRTSNGSYYRSTVFYSNASQQLFLNSTEQVRPQSARGTISSDIIDLDSTLRRIFKDYIGKADLTNVNPEEFRSIATVVYMFQYRAGQALYEVLLRTNTRILSIMYFYRIASPPIKNYFTILPSITWSNTQQTITANKAVLEFANRRFKPNHIDTISIAVSTNQATNKIRYCNSYLVDANFTTVCSSMNLLTRTANLDYYKIGLVATEPSIDLYTESDYTEMVNDSTFLLLDQTARQAYPALLAKAPIGKIEWRSIPGGRAYRLTYLGDRNNIQVGYNPQ